MMNRIDDQIEAHVELHARVVEGVEAALVGGELLGIGLAEGDQERRDHQRKPDRQRHADEDDDRQIILDQGGHRPLARGGAQALERCAQGQPPDLASANNSKDD